MLTCIAKIALLSNDYNLAMDCLEDAKSQHHCVNAAYMLWQLRQSKSQVCMFGIVSRREINILCAARESSFCDFSVTFLVTCLAILLMFRVNIALRYQ